MSLKEIVNDPEQGGGRLFALFIQSLIILSMLSLAFETLPNLSAEHRKLLRGFEVFTVAVFTVEYFLRVLFAEKRLKFVFSFLGLADLIAILPFYLSTGTDLRAVRGFRLLRLFRIFKLVRYSEAMRRYHRALIISREELILFGCASLIVLYISGVGIYYFEKPVQPEVFASVFHSLWWAVVSLTTVGYGDMVPVTVGGRLFTFVILVVGIGVIAVPTAALSSALSQARAEEVAAATISDPD